MALLRSALSLTTTAINMSLLWSESDTRVDFEPSRSTHIGVTMLFMIMEKFNGRDAVIEVYARFAERGRMLPDGLVYIDSWVEDNFARCFQLMETDDPSLIDQWTANWSDLVDFEVVRVRKSADAARQLKQ
jgi:hypothetical protein